MKPYDKQILAQITLLPALQIIKQSPHIGLSTPVLCSIFTA